MDLTKLDDGLDGEDNKKIKDKAKDPLSMPQGPIIRSRSKKLQESRTIHNSDPKNFKKISK